MSYTWPSQTAADASWVGLPQYTRPSPSEADASWISGNNAAGFRATSFGGPNTPTDAQGFAPVTLGTPALRMGPAGFSTTLFGEPGTLGYYFVPSVGVVTRFGTAQRDLRAAGFSGTQFGGAHTPTPAAGWSDTRFGTPVGYQFWQQWSLPASTRFGRAYFAQDQVCEARGASSTRVGAPTSSASVPLPMGWVTRAAGFLSPRFGAPASPIDGVHQASGARVTAFGTPTAQTAMLGIVTRFGKPTWRTVHAALPIPPAATFGQPLGAVAGRAQGWRPVQFGAPGAALTGAVQGRISTTFGQAATDRPDLYRAWPCDARARFGQPRAFRRFNYHAAGAAPATQVGLPHGFTTTRARALSPVTRFGTATRGGLQC